MTTADYALIVSILSLVISLGGLAWNVWSKFIFPKARVRVSFQVMTAYGVDARPQLTRMSLRATNFGPGQVRMHMAVVRISKGWFRKLQDGFINPLPSWDAEPTTGTGPFVGGMRNAIEEGADFAVYFPYSEKCFLREKPVDVGFVDTLGRRHWAPRKQVAKVWQQFQKAFPNAKPESELKKEKAS